eukprot:3748454-Prymnesium_polylepis.1
MPPPPAPAERVREHRGTRWPLHSSPGRRCPAQRPLTRRVSTPQAAPQLTRSAHARRRTP